MMDKKRFSGTYVFFLCLACMAVTGVLVYSFTARLFGGASEYSKYVSKFSNLIQAFDKYYIGDAELDEAAEAAYGAFVYTAGDRWSYYMTAEECKSYEDYISNEYQGIGITVYQDNFEEGITVASVSANTPAALAGIMAEDVIASVNGESCAGMEVKTLKSIIQNNSGGELVLTVKRGEEYLNITVQCSTIYTEPISYEMLDGSMGYVKINNFESGCADSFVSAVNTLMSEGAAALVFDVRGNPGGQLTELLDMLDYLLPEGELFISVDGEGKETIYSSDTTYVALPMAVLINSDSYSAAEFFAAALGEYGAAFTAGEPTTGKGRSQETFMFTDGSALHLSTNKYLTPNRIDLAEQGGLTPDIEVAFDEEEALAFYSGTLPHSEDAQIRAAASGLQEELDNAGAA